MGVPFILETNPIPIRNVPVETWQEPRETVTFSEQLNATSQLTHSVLQPTIQVAAPNPPSMLTLLQNTEKMTCVPPLAAIVQAPQLLSPGTTTHQH